MTRIGVSARLTAVFAAAIFVSAMVRTYPGSLPRMPEPSNNASSEAKVRLGRQLFFDPRLSLDNSISCATCHDPKTAWANHHATDTGIKGRVGKRNSGSIINSGYMKWQFWDGRARSLEEQALLSISDPVKMGENLDQVVSKLSVIPGYRRGFKDAFGTEVTAEGIGKALAAFERTIVSGDSPYDRYLAGDSSAMTESAVRGLMLFVGKADCADCHDGPILSDQEFHNIGVGMDKPVPDPGRENVTRNPGDRGRFKTPSLRNVAQTWPYLHDGSAKDLMDVIELYSRGGIKNPNLDPEIEPLDLTKQEKKDLVAFLQDLTGPVPKTSPPELPQDAVASP